MLLANWVCNVLQSIAALAGRLHYAALLTAEVAELLDTAARESLPGVWGPPGLWIPPLSTVIDDICFCPPLCINIKSVAPHFVLLKLFLY